MPAQHRPISLALRGWGAEIGAEKKISGLAHEVAAQAQAQAGAIPVCHRRQIGMGGRSLLELALAD